MYIIGAGLAGLLAGRMLARHNPRIVEAQASLPNNHNAVLRFRSPIVGDATGIPFRRVQMIKDALPWKNPVADALAYAYKATGKYTSDRSVVAGLTTAERWIAPPDLVAQLAEGQDISYKTTVTAVAFAGNAIISTMPMPLLMDLLAYPKERRPAFVSKSAFHLTATIADCDAFVSLLVPDPESPFSRISITGDRLEAEIPTYVAGDDVLDPSAARDFYVRRALEALGLDAMKATDAAIHTAKYAKIRPIDEDARRQFMFWATQNHNVYSLGRFATWRPRLLMDDLVQDVRKIERWVGSPGSHYDIKKDQH